MAVIKVRDNGEEARIKLGLKKGLLSQEATDLIKEIT